MKWLRLYHDTVTDPKWRVVAAESGQPLSAVLAVWMSMLINASDADERGVLQGWDDRFAGAALDLRGDAVRAIREAMQGVTLDGDRLTGWDKRQRVSDDEAAKKRKQRAQAGKNPPDGDGNGTAGDKPQANGHVPGHFSDVPGQTADVPRQAANVPAQSRDGPIACPEIPLVLSYLPSNPTTLIKDGGGDAGAREVARRVAELTRLKATLRNAATVEAWLTAGYDPDRDIYPAVAAVMDAAKDEIGCFKYFTKAIGRHHADRMAPPAPTNVSYLPHAAGGRQPKREDPAITRMRQRIAEERAIAEERGAL